jgi:FKBP-type peptidyl-prolyl cis-trans isomerase 2
MVEEGRVAVVHFVGRIAEGESAGEVFDTSDVDVALEEGIYHDHRDYKPLEFQVGEGAVLTGIEATIREMAVGEERTVRLDPAAAYGEPDADRVIEVPRKELEARSDAAAAEDELVGDETGETGWITCVTDDTVRIDFNHELAGEPVEFELRVLDVREGHHEKGGAGE